MMEFGFILICIVDVRGYDCYLEMFFLVKFNNIVNICCIFEFKYFVYFIS